MELSDYVPNEIYLFKSCSFYLKFTARYCGIINTTGTVGTTSTVGTISNCGNIGIVGTIGQQR